ncbi:exosortase/archaeosortase family protein [Fuerstiella marisgermanici]|uniref:Exosortase n=1 Tax=Fuerstiella marisgermanici TaxID=1891926 RepID=A0A1P8WPF1_9PLAN|nr:exosortase/archaeosortase family protein [Fuerstiella marisgermanici]APZ95918.1 exosortase [Fuerstiella marisgermanici]
MKSALTKALLLSAAVILLHSAFLAEVAKRLYSREHYQFFPMVLIAVGMIIWFRLKDYEGEIFGRISIRVFSYTVLATGIFAASTYLNSHWLGTVAALMAGWTLVWFIGGSPLASELRAPVSLLLLIMPLPSDYDRQLIMALQRNATEFASQMLDLSSIKHLPSGVTIQGTQKSFLVEEACSGIHSLFSCLCVVGVVCVIFRYGFLRAIVVLAQTIFWVLVANTLRVFLIVYCFTRWGWELDQGTAHEVLGIATYVVALGLTFSAHHLLLFVIPTKSSTSVNSPANGLKSKVDKFSRTLNEPRLSESASYGAAFALMAFVYAPLAIIRVWGN